MSIDKLREVLAAKAAEARARVSNEDERLASAALICALLHHAFASAATSLSRDGYVASVSDSTCGPVLRVGGCSITVQRFTLRDELGIEFGGFDLIPFDQRSPRYTIPALTVVEATALAGDFYAQIFDLLAEQLKRR